MSQDSPQNPMNPTRMGPIPGSAIHANPDVEPRGTAPAAAAGTPEQEAKRIEKIHAHSSSHHTAGTVTLDT